MLSILFLAYFTFIQRLKQDEGYTFSTTDNKEINLIKTSHYLNSIKKDQKNWYYVHFLTNDLSSIAKSISIQSSDMIYKNTFLLYLSYEQISLISNISFSKILDPEDKIKEESGPLEKAQYLLVFGSHNFVPEQNSRHYTIISKRNSNSYLISFKDNSMQKKQYVAKILAENPSVKSIVTYSKPVLKNNLMTGYTQKNTHQYSKDEKSGILYINRYLNEKGFTGKGQIVTVVDSLVDFHHAMFNDDNATFDVKTHLNHRKFVYYDYLGSVESLEDEIGEDEHGTHVAGTIAGETTCESNEQGFNLFNGNAPKAKLIFFNINTLPIIDSEVAIMDQFKSRISSNSWDYNQYSDSGNFEYGQGAYQNPQVVFIFAAGNEYTNGNFTVDDPSGSKNVISVGAIDDLLNTKRVSRFQLVDDSSIYLDAEQLSLIDPFYTGTMGTDNISDIYVFNAEETNNCDLFEKRKMFFGYATSREKASWIDKCFLYFAKGIFVSTEIEKIKELLEHSKSSQVSIIDITPVNSTKQAQHSSFSSGGPGNKGAIKPDLMAGGTRILSAKSVEGSHSFHGCRENGISDVTSMDGTSQATPNVAGATALIRQYFEDGNWTIKTVPSPVDLDGVTMRALLINSCSHPQDKKTPDVLYGHGVVDLSTILPFDGEFGVQITNQYTNPNHPSISEYGHKVAKFTLNSKKRKLQVTLSYLDSMLNAHSPILLTHDLDLVVVSPSGKVYQGDHIETGDSQHLSTNEKVIIDPEDLEIGDYSVHVYSGAFLDSDLNDNNNQNFSVVVSGNIENGYLLFSDADKCTGCDECHPDHPLQCKCDDSSFGAICQAHATIEKHESFSLTLKAHEIRRIMIKEKNFIYKINPIKNVEVEGVDDEHGYSTVWIDKKCHLELGMHEEYLGNFLKNKTLKTDINYGGTRMCITIFNNNFIDATFNVKVDHKSNMMYLYIGVGCFAGVVLIIIIVVVVVKTSKKQKLKGNGFVEIKSVN